MLNILKLFAFVFIAFMLSCADYKELDFSVKTGTLEDIRDGKTYKTVLIGEQEWMAENLNYKKSEGADSIGRCFDDTIQVNCDLLGRLYTWAEAMNLDTTYNEKHLAYGTPLTGICPEHWHIPTQNDWNKLVDYVGLNSGEKLKSKNGWKGDLNGVDEYEFKALPGGYFWKSGYEHLSTCAFWWSSTEDEKSNTISYSTWICPYMETDVVTDKTFYIAGKKAGHSRQSIRCIKD